MMNNNMMGNAQGFMMNNNMNNMNKNSYDVYKNNSNIVNNGIKIKEIFINHKIVKLYSLLKLYLFLLFFTKSI